MSSYREHLVSSPLVSCTWEQRTSAAWEQRVVPDGCVDLIWSGDRLAIAGPDTRARVVALAPGAHIVGVRLRPGVAGEVLGLPAGELRDAAPDAGDVLGHDRAEALLDALAGADGGADARAATRTPTRSCWPRSSSVSSRAPTRSFARRWRRSIVRTHASRRSRPSSG